MSYHKKNKSKKRSNNCGYNYEYGCHTTLRDPVRVPLGRADYGPPPVVGYMHVPLGVSAKDFKESMDHTVQVGYVSSYLLRHKCTAYCLCFNSDAYPGEEDPTLVIKDRLYNDFVKYGLYGLEERLHNDFIESGLSEAEFEKLCIDSVASYLHDID